MNRNIKHLLFACAILCSASYWACDSREVSKQSEQTEQTEVSMTPITYNIYVENSGSMKGYCKYSDPHALETLIDDLYERLNSCENTNHISLNFINTQIKKSNNQKKEFLGTIRSKCTADYTKIDDMLQMMMSTVNDTSVNFLISDYVFTTTHGNPVTAASEISTLFSKEIANRDLAVAIYKYMVNFDGRYYPGGIRCNKKLPLYIWCFGNKENIRQVSMLPFVTENCGEFLLQEPSYPEFKLEAKAKRAISGNKLHIKKWNSNNRGVYEFKFTVSLSDVLLKESEITNIDNYNISANNTSEYTINNIERIREDEYRFTIHTMRPAPGDITISFPIDIPEWVQESNFEGSGIPDDGKTYCVAYLIEAVDKAFKDAAGQDNYNYFELKIKAE